ncbi:MAG: hypothetical protein SPLM_10000 [Spiroplasma phoeniceum]|uniref:lipoprotein n=1 Tax=Spiroplasma phoeniceum TaxID=47835 RepID=UPI0031340F37
MKKILSLLGTITLIGTSTASLVACDKIYEYTPEELKELKEKNKINTKNQEIRDNLEWIAPQEKPFNKIDNKYYYVIWKSQKWNISKFKNNILIDRTHPSIEIDNKNEDENYKLNLEWYNKNGIINTFFIRSYSVISDWPAPRFKSVYRWNLTTPEPDLVIDDKGNVKVKGE